MSRKEFGNPSASSMQYGVKSKPPETDRRSAAPAPPVPSHVLSDRESLNGLKGGNAKRRTREREEYTDPGED